MVLERCEARRLLATSFLSIDSPTILEGDDGTRLLTFTVTLDPANIEDTVTVDYTTDDGTAREGEDYSPRSGQLMFLPDEVETTITVPITGDLDFETDETFVVLLSAPVNAEIADGEGTGTILNDDPPPSLAIAPVSVVEGSGQALNEAVFVVTLSQPSGLPVEVSFRTIADTATEGESPGSDPVADYIRTQDRLVFEPGETERTIRVPIVPDNDPEPDETFRVELSDPAGATIAVGTATGTILDDDEPPDEGRLIVPAAVSVGESAGQVIIPISTDGATPLDVHLATIAVTAQAEDFTPVAIDLTVQPPHILPDQSIRILILPDDRIEGAETFIVRFTTRPGPTAPGQTVDCVVTILDDDSLIVTNTNDSGPGSLRAAMLAYNGIPGRDTIQFGLPGLGPYTIRPLSPLPAITDPLVLDASALPGRGEAAPNLILDGRDAGPGVNGLVVLAGSSVVKGVEIVRFDASAILIQDGGGNLICGDVLGLEGQGNGRDGVTIVNSSNNLIGVPGATSGPAAAPAVARPGAVGFASNRTILQAISLANGNIFSGNAGMGVRIVGAGSRGNLVVGNAIGAVGRPVAGRPTAGNVEGGIFLDGAPSNRIGLPGSGNVISANPGAGVQITGATAAGNFVEGNRIGTDDTGTTRLPNRFDGIYVENAPGTVVGGIADGAGNLVSGNGFVGVRLLGPGTVNTLVVGNRLGTNADGTGPLGNRFDGVFIHGGASNNTVGGIADGLGNLISGNESVGVQVFEPHTRGNVIIGNRVGTNANGTGRLGNERDGVFINDSPGNVVGMPGAGNLVSANGSVGVQVFAPGSVGNVVQANRIGTDAAGVPRLGNLFGLYINMAPRNVIGGRGPARNVVEGNRASNVLTNTGQGGPFVLSWETASSAGLVNSLLLTFSAEMDPARAVDLGNYRLSLVAGRRSSTPLALAGATYDPARRMVRLTLAQPVSVGSVLRLTVSGRGPGGLTDTARRLLDGDANSRPGGDSLLTIDTSVVRGVVPRRGTGLGAARRGGRNR